MAAMALATGGAGFFAAQSARPVRVSVSMPDWILVAIIGFRIAGTCVCIALAVFVATSST